jgi:DNA-directed RNA polymerase
VYRNALVPTASTPPPYTFYTRALLTPRCPRYQDVDFPPIPPLGSLDLDHVKDSEFFFS